MHGAVGLVDTPSGAFVWCGWCWCCVAGGGPILLPALSTIQNPPSAVIILPAKQNALAPPFRRSTEASYHRTRPTNPIHRPFLGGWVSVELAGWGRPRVVLIDQPGCRAAVLPRFVLLPADQPSLAASLPRCRASRFAAPLVSTGGSPSVAALRLGWPEGATPESCSVQQWTTPI